MLHVAARSLVSVKVFSVKDRKRIHAAISGTAGHVSGIRPARQREAESTWDHTRVVAA